MLIRIRLGMLVYFEDVSLYSVLSNLKTVEDSCGHIHYECIWSPLKCKDPRRKKANTRESGRVCVTILVLPRVILITLLDSYIMIIFWRNQIYKIVVQNNLPFR